MPEKRLPQSSRTAAEPCLPKTKTKTSSHHATRCHGCDFRYKYHIIYTGDRVHATSNAWMSACEYCMVHKYKPICIRFTGGYMSWIQKAERRRFNDILVSCTQWKWNHGLTRFAAAKCAILLFYCPCIISYHSVVLSQNGLSWIRICTAIV